MPKERQEQYQAVSFADNTGGINKASSPTLLANNEAQDIVNMEYYGNRIKTRGGLSAPLRTYPSSVQSVFYIESTNTYLVVLQNGHIYEDNLTTISQKVGECTGSSRPCFCPYDNKVFIASGNKLQYYDTSVTPHTVTTIANSKLCDNVFERNGRLVISCEGDDTIYFSATGNPYETGWVVDSNDDSSSQWVEVGYKDDGDILKVVPIAQDLIVFKSNGRIYDLSGEYPNWVVTTIAQKSDVRSKYAIDNVSGTALFINGRGLMALQANETYGNFNVAQIGRKFNKVIEGNVVFPRTYNLYRKYQFMICPNTTSTKAKSFICFHHDIGAATRMEFPFDITDMADTLDGVIIASGASIYRWHERYTTDNGTAITSQIISREIMGMDKIFTRRLDFDVIGETGDLTVTLNNETFSFPISQRRNIKELYTKEYYATVTLSATSPYMINNIVFYYINT